MVNVFHVPGMLELRTAFFLTGIVNGQLTSWPTVFFVLFRETLETAIIVSVLLSFLKQTLDPVEDKVTLRKLRRQVALPLSPARGWPSPC